MTAAPERLQEFIGTQGGSQCAEDACRGVPVAFGNAVRNARRYDRGLARLGEDLPAADPAAHRALQVASGVSSTDMGGVTP